ncbi:MAG: hypothetical protein JWQ14_2410 [Adhaeribacter sp.]|nr:hypothetical protein [Adhaeribacter sp.]
MVTTNCTGKKKAGATEVAPAPKKGIYENSNLFIAIFLPQLPQLLLGNKLFICRIPISHLLLYHPARIHFFRLTHRI